MANYLSNTFETSPIKSSINLPLLDKVMSMRQGKYDANKAQVDQTLALYQERLKGRRDIDNQYIALKLTDVRSSIDQAGDIDWSRSNNAEGVMNKIKSLTKDPVIMSAVLNKAKVDQYNMQVDEIRKKDAKSYNDVNYQYGLYKGKVDAYDRGEVNDIGNLNYIPYTDLTEEALKSVKTIKDIRGKRFFEEQAYDENGNAIPGKLIRREIDGLTPTEIQNYFGSTLTSQQLTQMKINGWAKYAQPQTKDLALEKYKEFNNLSLKQKEDEYQGLLAESKNPNKDKATRERALKLSNELKETIDGMKNLDYSKIDPETVGFELEKMGFVNGLSQMAGTEWSTEHKTDDYYFEMQKLDIDRQQLEIAKRKEARESGVDENGNPILDGVISTTPASTELAKTLSEEQAGVNTLESVHDKAYQEIEKTAKDFLNNATKEDKALFEGYLAKRGITPDLKFKDQEKAKEYSLVNTIYEAFKDGGFNETSGTYGERMQKAYKLKQESARNITSMDRDVYFEEFRKKPDEYLTTIIEKTMENTADANLEQEDLKKLDSSISQIKNLYQKATGGNLEIKVDFLGQAYPVNSSWSKVKQELKNAINTKPYLVKDLAEIREYTGKYTLKEATKSKKEEWIKKRTDEGVMMSAYTQSNILDEKLRAKIIGSVSEGEVTLEDGETKVNARFDPKKNLTVSREGEDVIIRQVNEAPTGTEGKNKVEMLKYRINPQSSAYAELSKYIDLQFVDNRVIKATKDTEFEEVKPKMMYHTDTKDVRDKKVTAVALNFSPQLSSAFDGTGIPPVKLASALATKDTAEGVIELLLKNRGIEEQKAKQYTQKLLENINSYKLKVTSQNNINDTGYDFAINVTKPNGSLLFRRSLGVGAIDTKTDYLLDNYPQIFILNQKIKDVLEEPNRIDTLINEL